MFIVLSLLLWFGYLQFVAPRYAPQPQTQPPVTIQPVNGTKPQTPEPVADNETMSGQVTPTNTPNPVGEFSHPVVPPATRVIRNDYLFATFSNTGGTLESVALSRFCAHKSKDDLKLICPIEVIIPGQSRLNNLYLKTLDDAAIESANWEIIEETPQSVTFRYTTPGGLVIRKKFGFQGNYSIDYQVSMENISAQPITTTLVIGGGNGIIPEQNDRLDLFGVRAYRDKQKNAWYLKNIGLPALQKDKTVQLITDLTKAQGLGRTAADNVDWTGLVNKYFTSILIPTAPADISEYDFNLLGENNIGFSLVTNPLVLNPMSVKDMEFILYCGPKEKQALSALSDYGFDGLLDYGIFGFISKILLFIMGATYGIFKNYGLAIIILTILIKVILFPLTRKGQVSMYQLQKLSPRIKALQEQYKNDKQKLAAEQMKLWKEYGVNPLSGCLPMFFQIPVFFGLYWALALSIELRQAPFMLWITDLSQPDQLFKLPSPILGATHLHLLPLLMTASWLIQSLTQPKSPDPQTRQQQKIMAFMPLIFLFFFYNVPSGLTLYWFTSTLLGIVEQQLIKKFYLK